MKVTQPALKSYFFDKGYKDVKNTIMDAWKLNIIIIQNYWQRIKFIQYGEKFKALLQLVCYGAGILSILLFGSALTVVISLINAIALVLFMSIIYLGFSVIWLVDRLYLIRKKIFTACPACKEKSLIPTYICPNCGVEHTNLTPSVYGILHHICAGPDSDHFCGAALPSTFFNGRRHLDAICPACRVPLSSSESVPICVPVVGGSSVGKTAFITAFSKEFIEKIAPSKGWKSRFYNVATEGAYTGEMSNAYTTGTTTKTIVPTDINQASAASFSFFVEGEGFSPERLIHVYDIAGEFFTGSAADENEIQRQYDYCHGIVMVIDPFAIPEVLFKYETKLNEVDYENIGKADIEGIIDTFINKIKSVTGLTDTKMSKVPLAILINKIDSADLEDELGEARVHEMMNPSDKDMRNKYDVMDYLCREFLKENGMSSFLNVINNRFKSNRFFACSAIGHTKGDGQFTPKGVMAPMEWIFRNADSVMAKKWTNTEFTKKPFAAS